jgi:hypothetical protein
MPAIERFGEAMGTRMSAANEEMQTTYNKIARSDFKSFLADGKK